MYHTLGNSSAVIIIIIVVIIIIIVIMMVVVYLRPVPTTSWGSGSRQGILPQA